MLLRAILAQVPFSSYLHSNICLQDSECRALGLTISWQSQEINCVHLQKMYRLLRWLLFESVPLQPLCWGYDFQGLWSGIHILMQSGSAPSEHRVRSLWCEQGNSLMQPQIWGLTETILSENCMWNPASGVTSREITGLHSESTLEVGSANLSFWVLFSSQLLWKLQSTSPHHTTYQGNDPAHVVASGSCLDESAWELQHSCRLIEKQEEDPMWSRCNGVFQT